jgi:hypothetical protein
MHAASAGVASSVVVAASSSSPPQPARVVGGLVAFVAGAGASADSWQQEPNLQKAGRGVAVTTGLETHYALGGVLGPFGA